MATIVIMPGGFHPFHAGHMSLYSAAQKAFPNAEVYVAATNSQEERPFPFAVKEKLAKVAGVESGHFIQVKSPFQSKEITQNYNPEQDVLIFVRSEKDRNESPKPGGIKKDGTPAYFQPYDAKNLQPFGKHAYFAYLPTVKFGPGITSATEIRRAWPTLDNRRKTAMVMSLYPATQKNPKLANVVMKMLDQVMDGQQGVSETINPDIQNKRFSHTQVIGDYTYKASVEWFMRSPLLYIRAYDGDKQIGEVLFEIITRYPGGKRDPTADYLESGGTEVEPEYRNKGVASTMYAYAKMLGNDIVPSDNQRSDGKAMWAAWKKSDDAKHLIGTAAESAVAEGDENIYRRPTAGEASKISQQTNAKLNPVASKFVWKKPNQLGGSFSEQDLVSKGFKKSQYNSWGGTQAMWDRLLSIKEDEMAEARVLFTDPNTKVNVYYNSKNPKYYGKPVQVGKAIPYNKIDQFISMIVSKYQVKPTEFVWSDSRSDRTDAHIVHEVSDYLEEK